MTSHYTLIGSFRKILKLSIFGKIFHFFKITKYRSLNHAKRGCKENYNLTTNNGKIKGKISTKSTSNRDHK